MRTDKLPKIDITSSTWTELRAHILTKLSLEYKKLADVNLDERSTSVIRGYILALENVLSLEDKTVKNNQQAF